MSIMGICGCRSPSSIMPSTPPDKVLKLSDIFINTEARTLGQPMSPIARHIRRLSPVITDGQRIDPTTLCRRRASFARKDFAFRTGMSKPFQINQPFQVREVSVSPTVFPTISVR